MEQLLRLFVDVFRVLKKISYKQSQCLDSLNVFTQSSTVLGSSRVFVGSMSSIAGDEIPISAVRCRKASDPPEDPKPDPTSCSHFPTHVQFDRETNCAFEIRYVQIFVDWLRIRNVYIISIFAFGMV